MRNTNDKADITTLQAIVIVASLLIMYCVDDLFYSLFILLGGSMGGVHWSYWHIITGWGLVAPPMLWIHRRGRSLAERKRDER